MATGNRRPGKGKQESEPAQRAEDAKPQENEKWDDVSEASWESFPASDPPSFTMRKPSDPPK